MLYLVATPIGNLKDISQRAKEVLSSVPLIACEDTRTTKQLLTLLGIAAPALTAYHQYNAEKACPGLVEKLKQKTDIALVSDAGMPLISDPGYKLVQACYENDIPVTTIPGANALLCALQLSGLPSDKFYFGGFLSPKTGARCQALESVRQLEATLIFYEAPHRILGLLGDIHKTLGNRQIALVREITKKFESVERGACADLLEKFTKEGVPKGEMVVVIDRTPGVPATASTDVLDVLRHLLKFMPLKQAVDAVAKATKLPHTQVYKWALEEKKNNADEL